MKLFIILISALILQVYLSRSEAIDTTKFGSKNSYASSMSDQERQQAKETIDTINKYCEALQVSSVLRHGTRNPSTGDINNINSVLKKFQATGANAASVQQLANVVNQFPIDTQGQLVEAGKLEHQGLGYRMAEIYQNLLGQAGLDQLSFSATTVNRTVDSCKAFQQGFFNQHGRPLVANIAIRNDILRFYDTCDAYQELEANSSSQIQFTTFQAMKFDEISTNYVNSLQLPSVNITNDEMDSIYQIAAIEYAALNTTFWAEYINSNDLLTLEYSGDLDSYYKIGYGYPINYEMSCPLISQLFMDMDKVFNGQSYLKGLFYFAHAETITPLFDILGLYKDTQPLTADNFPQQTNRLFRTSQIVPFASNIAFVQYDCNVQSIIGDASSIPPGIFPPNPQKNMTLMLVKESPTKFPKSDCDTFLCPYTAIRKVYSQPIDNCNYNATCDNFQSSSASTLRALFGASFLINIISIILAGFL